MENPKENENHTREIANNVVRRDSNIELLRIVAILLIVISHFSYHGYNRICGGYDQIVNSLNRILIFALDLGNIGNVIFMLITGYFLCMSKSMKYRKLTNVILQVFTYSVVCYLLHQLFIASEFHIEELYFASTPLIHNTYWYFSTYVLIYLFHPYINIMITNLQKKELERLILTMIVVWSIIPCVFEVNFEKNNFVTFFLVYCIGAHLRLYPNSWYYKRYKSLFFLCVLLWGCMAISILFEPSIFTGFLKRLNTNGSILVVGIGTSMLLFAISTKFGYSKIVNVTAGTVGGGIFVA